MKSSASPADAEKFRRLMSELAVVVSRIVKEDKARRRALVGELRARAETVDAELADSETLASR